MASDENDISGYTLRNIDTMEVLLKTVRERGVETTSSSYGNTAFKQQNSNRPYINQTASNSSINSHVRSNKEVEKTKRTRRKPRTKKSKDDDVSNARLNISASQNNVNHISLPSTSKGVTNSPSPSKGNIQRTAQNRQVELQYRFTINPINTNTAGQLIRRRNLSFKYVNLKSYVKSTNLIPLVFTTKLPSVTNLSKKFSKLSTNNQKAKMTKAQLRKYPEDLQPSLSSKKPRRKEKKSKSDTHKFPNYIDIDEVHRGLENRTLVKGFLRINPKNFKDSYVGNEDTSIADYYLTSVLDRNRALEGDEVILKVKPEKEWIDGKKTVQVVSIAQLIHPRTAIGCLRPAEKSRDYAVFYPRDKRIPIMRIAAVSWPNGFKNNPKQYEKILFVAKVTDWAVPSYAVGVLIENLGLSGDLKVETMSILREFCLDTTPFSPEICQNLPKSGIPETEFRYREDRRTDCVFTIDPSTARDLDDAVSVKELPNGNYEIGVHISDAAYYLEEGTELDQIVSRKATSIYLVNETYHMLPVELCLHCSLLPGQDKLSFSVFWEMTEEAEIINKRFTRTVINSCSQLAYEHAQIIIENPDKHVSDHEFPPIHNGYSTKEIKRAVEILQKIAVKLRDRRIQNGALKIDQVKLSYSLDPRTGEPVDFWKYENKESHRLIEEFMLLANISVAERISEFYPDVAFLRCHEPPKKTMLVELQNSLATCGIHIDISSSGGIHASLMKYITDDFPGQCRAAVLNHITAKAMTRARYFCASTVESELEYKHYALSVPIYTHFTSPIRRYADIMVHRLLAATLDYHEKPEWDTDYVSAIAANCNGQKYNAKRAGEASSELYLAHYVEKHQPFIQDCVVIDVKERSFGAIVLKTGSVIRIYQNNCEEGTIWKTESIATIKVPAEEKTESENGEQKGNYEKKLFKLTITFPKTNYLPESSIIVETFTTVKVNLERKTSYKLEAKLLRPIVAQVFTRQ
ncbi:hypothetical protein NQ318_022706 [Aromia moschata]|uniref:RNB domain-containing protein n=1 Tax=Aromia moschata TaxID=1265417 RepID=A0AAV8YAM3_9CUCU|nr:hypothetical protein NQ318_022706 [Aromia moschata]